MDELVGKITGFIHIAICETSEGNKFFSLQADNQDVLPILDIIEDTLSMY